MAPAVTDFHGFAFLRGGMTPWAPRSAIASWHFSGIVGTVGGDAADLLIRRDLVEQIGQHRRMTDLAPGDLDGPYFQRLFVDPEVDLTPDPLFCTAMVAGVPLAFHLDPCAVDQQM